MYRNDTRVFQRAVLISIVLHGLLLFGIPQSQPSFQRAADAAPLVARLAEPTLVEEATPPRAAQPQRRKPVPRARATPEPTDPGVVAIYRLEIISLARQFKRYPPVARENNWAGKAEVRLSFDPQGKRPSVAILKSSGYPILDRQAVDTMTRAVAPLPLMLRGRQFALDIPVIFNLDD